MLEDLLPAAIGVALSPLPIVAVILILGTPRARIIGPLFAIGWITGLAVLSTLVVILGDGRLSNRGEPGTLLSWGRVLIGVVLVIFAARIWKRRPRPGESAPLPRWMETLGAVHPRRATLVGAALSSANPLNVALTTAAAAAIVQREQDAVHDALGIIVFVVLGSLTVAGPALWYLLDPQRALRRLVAVRNFMSSHNAAIMATLLVVLGVKLMWNGLRGLAG